jgi:glycyl-tRNA synthetase
LSRPRQPGAANGVSELAARNLRNVDLETIVSLSKRRGFVFQSSEIYGGLGSVWDYGPVGVELKRNVKDMWWKSMVRDRDDVVGIDAAILMHPDVWVASGHVSSFTDPLVECSNCNQRIREDHVQSEFGEPIDINLSSASVERIEVDGEDLLILNDVVIDVPDTSIKAEHVMLSWGFVEPLAAERIPEGKRRRFVLEASPDKRLSAGKRPYQIAYQIRDNAKKNLDPRIEFAFSSNGKNYLRRQAININLSENQLELRDVDNACPRCGELGCLSSPRQFNMMFKTHIGPVESDDNVIYLRPETAQAMFVQFENVQTTTRKKLPFGIAQQGKSFRNEITPGNFTFRTREFEQMEMEYFCKPGEDLEWHKYWIQFSMDWFTKFGLRRDKLKVREHTPDELPHYSAASADIEFEFPWGWGELETISDRTDYDLKAHIAKSGKDLSYFDQEANERFVPFVVEPAMGADRSALAFLVDAYDEEGEGKDQRVVLRFHPDIAPFQVAVLPLSRNDKLTPKAREVYDVLRPVFNCQYDDSQSIGRRYRRQDEIGTPLCVTVDFETVESDDAVTIRNRDSMEQVRVPVSGLVEAVRKELDVMRRQTAG